MALTKVTGQVVNTSTDLTVGVLTATTATFTGNVSVGGTLTYEDVTNVDSVGLITARNGVNISGGNLQVGGTNVINSGRALLNVEEIKLADTKELVLGSGNDFKIYHSGSHSFISEEGAGALKIRGDDVRFEDAGGTEALRIDSDGRLLLGTTTEGNSGADDLTIATSGNTGITIRSGTSDYGNIYYSDATSGTGEYAGYVSYQHSTNSLQFATASTERLRIDSSGVITTDSGHTTARLNVVNGNTVSTYDKMLLLRSNNLSNAVLGLGSDSFHICSLTNAPIVFHTNSDGGTSGSASPSNERMRIDSSGNVGIKNTVAATIDAVNNAGTLVVGDGSSAEGITIYTSDSTSGELAFADGTSGSATQRGRIIYAHGDNSMRISTNGSERIRIDSSGNFGIGLTGPSEPLHVDCGAPSSSDKIIAQFQSESSRQLYIGWDDSQSTMTIGTNNNHPLCFHTNGQNTERMRIDSSGNVAIGPNTQGHGLLTLSKSASSAFNALVIQQGNTGSADSDGLHIGIDSAVDAYITHKENRALAFGTANTERMRIDSSGIVKINQATGNTFRVQNSTSGEANMLFQNSSTGTNAGNGLYIGIGSDEIAYVWHYHNESLVFAQNNTERARINTSGDFLVGTSSHSPGLGNQNSGFQVAAAGYIAVSRSGGQPCYFNRRTNTGTIVGLSYNGTQRGTISTDGTVVAFNTSSDHRLKENIVDLDGAITRVKQLQPRRFNFIESPSTTIDGFVAHEAQTVVPEAVTGTHNEVDDDNNPVYQGIDTSKLVPLLTAALQEAIAEIETLKTKVAALEG